MPEKSQITLGELVELAVEKELVQFCYIARKVVIISLGRHQLSFPPDEARLFLHTLVQGWSRSRLPGESKRSKRTPDVLREDLFSTPQRLSGLSREPTSTDEPEPEPAPTSVEDYVDLILAFAQQIGIVKDYYKDAYTRKVTLQTQDTTTDMPYLDTLEYLMTSILDVMRADLQG